MYPTREQAEMMATLHDEVTPTSCCGKRFIAAHDALDAKQAEVDGMKLAAAVHRGAANTILDVNLQLQAELDKAKDLIRRFVNNDNNQGTTEFSIWWNEMNSIMDEAETILNGKQAQT